MTIKWTDETLAAARARGRSLDARIGAAIKRLRDAGVELSAPCLGTVQGHPRVLHYINHGGAEPTDADIETAVRAAGPRSSIGVTASDAAAEYAARLAKLEQQRGRSALPAEKVALARETGYAALSEQSATAASRDPNALDDAAIQNYLKAHEAATGEDTRGWLASKQLNVARTLHAQALARIPKTPVTDEIARTGREPTVTERVAMEYEQRELEKAR